MNTYALAITGSGGAGVVTAGTLLLNAAARAGYYGWMLKSFGPQIRGGESSVMLYLSDAPIERVLDRFDLLLGLDWKGFERFADEVPLHDNAVVWHDSHAHPPELLQRCSLRALPLNDTARTFDKGRINMVATGALAAELGLPLDAVQDAVHKLLSRKGDAVVEAGQQQVAAGHALIETPSAPLRNWHRQTTPRWVAAGNPLTGLGLLRGGVRFVSAYPITPATDLLEWLAPRLPTQSGVLIQAEDELAAINMAIGASFTGTPAATATSGPGLALMTEGIGLAIASETPVTLINVNRGGPSTGIPTKSEQSDLETLLFAPHGDSPHIVVAPLGFSDLAPTAQWAAYLADRLQTVAMVASEQALAQASAIVEPVPDLGLQAERLRPAGKACRYAPTESGVSPMPLPALDDARYVADGLEHTECGVPSSFATDHRAQLEKRQRKLETFDYGARALAWEGPEDPDTVLIAIGSLWPTAVAVADERTTAGHPTAVLGPRLLMPLPAEQIDARLAQARQVWVLENNHSAQLYHYLRGHLNTPLHSFAQPGPLPIQAGEVLAALEETP
ncbi:2-oxoglutarate ferredoxin oxidoreductase subunit alpha [Sulfurivirga caldicuralii]|uniref:2-oxoglutarate ferredoxin oxidoreductase subunit alpha n=1 Tax=Sulfurivirga caldicuralii TaxID=364032 RepID=A0A1N6DG21_9GAMM|nr:2-oxoacid:acceptor oxidoreductase family protein [Sulfurivirga caldicuralii]SIN69742.1 2-oxoglutarate ferredoxin oxidoreductase subunit alpha [Sulfurivirga caldicuralii]